MTEIEAKAGAAGAGADGGAGGTGAAGSAAEGAGKGAEGEAEGKSRSKAWEAAEAHKKEAADLKTKLAGYEKKERDAADADALKKGEYEKLAKQKDEVATQAQARADRAVRKAALIEEGTKLGLSSPDFLRMLDVESVKVDGETVTGAAEAMKALKVAHPECFGVPDLKNKDTTTSRGTAGGEAFDPGSVRSVADVEKLSPENRKAYIRSRGGAGVARLDPLTGARKA